MCDVTIDANVLNGLLYERKIKASVWEKGPRMKKITERPLVTGIFMNGIVLLAE